MHTNGLYWVSVCIKLMINAIATKMSPIMTVRFFLFVLDL